MIAELPFAFNLLVHFTSRVQSLGILLSVYFIKKIIWCICWEEHLSKIWKCGCDAHWPSHPCWIEITVVFSHLIIFHNINRVLVYDWRIQIVKKCLTLFSGFFLFVWAWGVLCLSLESQQQEKLGPCFLGNQLEGSQKKIFVDECEWSHLLFLIILYIGLKRRRKLFPLLQQCISTFTFLKEDFRKGKNNFHSRT